MEPDHLDRLIAAGWGSVDGLDIPPEVLAAAKRGDPVPPHRIRKKTGRKPKEGKPLAPSRWFADGEKPQLFKRGTR